MHKTWLMKFSLVSNNLVFPPLYPEAERTLATSKSKSRTVVDGYELRPNQIDLIPQPGLQEQLCQSEANLVFICGQATSGKAQPYTSKVLTPNGFVEMGSLNIGDIILAPDNSTQRVLNIFEQGEIDVWRLTFDDGAQTECCKNHLWKVRTPISEWRVIRFEDVLSAFNAHLKIYTPHCASSVYERFKAKTPDTDKPRKLVRAEYVGKKQCRCIMVSGAEHLYVTDDFIVTHNTFAMYLNALQGVTHYGFAAKLISVRLQDSKKGGSMFRDGVTVCGNFANCEYNSADYPTFSWPQWNSSLQLIHSNFNVSNPAEWEQFQDYAKKVQASLIMVDEATEMKEFKMFAYWFSRNRDSSGMTPQMVLSFNPSHDHWTTQMLCDAGYIGDDWYLRKDMIGKVRYWYNKGKSPAEIVWGDSREEVANAAGLIDRPDDLAAGISRLDYVKSFTVLTGTAASNRELVNATGGQSVANLHATGAEQRQIVGEGYFGEVEAEEINVSREMINNLWLNPISDDVNMYATMDISSGKADNDKSPMVIWRGLQIVGIELFSGEPNEMAGWIKTKLNAYGVDVTRFAYDATGHGYWMQGLTNGVAVTANKRAIQEVDEFGNAVTRDDYFNCRSQLLGRTEVMIKRGDISCSISPDLRIPYAKGGATRALRDILYDEINVFATTTRNKRIYYRSKDEYRAKFRHSPDLMDAICLRAVFELDARPKKAPLPTASPFVYNNLYSAFAYTAKNRWNKNLFR